jgi:hypothetical protein
MLGVYNSSFKVDVRFSLLANNRTIGRFHAVQVFSREKALAVRK